MKGKARKNLEVALLLLDRGYIDASATRLYYAVFQAAVHALRAQGREPAEFRRGARDWDHEILGRAIHLARGEPSDRILFRDLRHQRELADYRDGPAERNTLEYLKHDAIRFVDEVTK